MVIIMGWPREYYAIYVKNRYKGNPVVTQITINQNDIKNHDSVRLDCHPDENGFDDVDDPRNYLHPTIPHAYYVEYRLATEAWNETQWQAK